MNFKSFYHLSVPGDGACFFHTLVTILEIEGDPTEENIKFKKILC